MDDSISPVTVARAIYQSYTRISLPGNHAEASAIVKVKLWEVEGKYESEYHVL